MRRLASGLMVALVILLARALDQWAKLGLDNTMIVLASLCVAAVVIHWWIRRGVAS